MRSPRPAAVAAALLLLAWAPGAAALQAPAAPPGAPSSEAARLRELAELRYVEGNYEAAAGLYHQLASYETEAAAKVQALINAALMEHRLDQDATAAETLERALRLDPDAPFQPENYSSAFVVLFQEAQRLVRAERQRAVGDSLRLAIQKRAAGDLAGARRLFQEAVALDPGHPVPQFYLAMMDLEADRRADGEERLRRLLDLADRNRDSRLFADLRAQALIRLALIDEQEGRIEAAIADLQRILSLDRAVAESPLSPGLRVQALGQLGLLYYRIGMFDDAAANLEEAVRLDPTNGAAWHNLGLARLALDRRTEAIVALRRASQHAPGDETVARSLAMALTGGGRWGEAAEVLAESARVNPEAPEIWLALARARRELGDRVGAGEAYGRVVALDSGNRSGLAQPASLELAILLHEQGRHERAVEYARQAAGWDDSDLAAWNQLGLSQQALGLDLAALESFRRAMAIDPERGEVMSNLGFTYLALDRVREAEQAFRRALELRPDLSGAAGALETLRRNLAASLARLGLRISDAGGSGARVDEVEKPSPAARGKLRPGDVVVRFAGQAVDGADTFRYLAYDQAEASEITLLVIRDGVSKELRLRLD